MTAVLATVEPTVLVLAAGCGVVSAGLALRARPASSAAGSAMSGRIAAWTAPAAVLGADHDVEGEGALTPAVELRGTSARIQAALELTDVRVGARTLVRRTLVATVVIAVLAFLIFPPLALAALVGVPLVVRGHVRRLVRRRRTRFADQLGDTVQAIGSAMRAGHGISAAISMQLDDLPQPTQEELRRVIAAERIGVPFERALDEAVVRMASTDLEQVALVASLQRDTGGNGAEALDRVVETIRGRDDVRRLVSTLTAQGRMSRWVLTGLPVGLTLVMSVVGHGYLTPLLTTGLGHLLTAVACLMLVVGSVWIGHVVEIDV